MRVKENRFHLTNYSLIFQVADFGLVRLGSSGNDTIVLATQIIGSRGYMAPEVKNEIIHAKLDVFSFGIVSYFIS